MSTTAGPKSGMVGRCDEPPWVRSGCPLRREHDRTRCVAESLLTRLVEEPLGSVTFVQDYVRLDSGDARLTAYA